MAVSDAVLLIQFDPILVDTLQHISITNHTVVLVIKCSKLNSQVAPIGGNEEDIILDMPEGNISAMEEHAFENDGRQNFLMTNLLGLETDVSICGGKCQFTCQWIEGGLRLGQFSMLSQVACSETEQLSELMLIHHQTVLAPYP